MAELTQKQKEQVQEEVDKQVKKEVKKHISFLEKTGQFGSEFKSRATTGIIAGLSLVIALSWNDLIRKIITSSVPDTGSFAKYPFLPELITTIIITFVAVVGIIMVSHWAKKPEEKK